MYSSFEEISAAAAHIGPEKVTVVFPHEPDVLCAVADGMKEGLIEPILIGDKRTILKTVTRENIFLEKPEIINIQDPQDASDLALDLVKRGDAAFALCFHTLSAIPKIFVITDPGVNIRPDTSFKEKILSNALWVLRALGCGRPRVMALACRRFKDDSSAYTHEAQDLQNRAHSGRFGPCEFLPYTDLTQLARAQGISAQTFPELFLVPHIDAGNILVKTIDHIMGGQRQCLTIGAGMILLTPSRSDGYQQRIQNLALGLVVARATSRKIQT